MVNPNPNHIGVKYFLIVWGGGGASGHLELFFFIFFFYYYYYSIEYVENTGTCTPIWLALKLLPLAREDYKPYEGNCDM